MTMVQGERFRIDFDFIHIDDKLFITKVRRQSKNFYGRNLRYYDKVTGNNFRIASVTSVEARTRDWVMFVCGDDTLYRSEGNEPTEFNPPKNTYHRNTSRDRAERFIAGLTRALCDKEFPVDGTVRFIQLRSHNKAGIFEMDSNYLYMNIPRMYLSNECMCVPLGKLDFGMRADYEGKIVRKDDGVRSDVMWSTSTLIEKGSPWIPVFEDLMTSFTTDLHFLEA